MRLPGTPTFTITFTPTSLGAKTATVTIANDDADENPYTFTLTGTGVAPEINVKQGSTPIASGGSHDFGSVKAEHERRPVVFTIENPGTAALNLTGTPKVSISGADAPMFTVGTQPASPIAPAGSTHVHDHLHPDERRAEEREPVHRQRRCRREPVRDLAHRARGSFPT